MTSYISSIDADSVYENVRKAFSLGNLVLFAGAGLSHRAATKDGRHPPLWKDLLHGMIKWFEERNFFDGEYATQLTELVNDGHLLDAGQEIEDKINEKLDIQRALMDVLLCNEAQASDAHQLIVKLPFKAFITSNYDCLIEDEFKSQNGMRLQPYMEKTLPNALDDFRENRKFIFKMHGTIDDPDSIVLGTRKYENLVYTNRPQEGGLGSIVALSSILFIGFGVTDPHLDFLLSKVAAFDGRRKRHWLLAAQGSFHPLKAKRLYLDKGINVIEYKKDATHSGVTRFFERLTEPPPKKIITFGDSSRVKRLDLKRKIERKPD